MKIRKIARFSVRVYEAVLILLPQLSSDSTLPAREQFEEILKSKNTHFFIAELDKNEIAGILTLVRYNIPTGTKVWIEDVVVDETHRGKGIGKALILHAISFAESAGAKSVELTSRPSRIAANKLYHELGFMLRETNVYRFNIK